MQYTSPTRFTIIVIIIIIIMVLVLLGRRRISHLFWSKMAMTHSTRVLVNILIMIIPSANHRLEPVGARAWSCWGQTQDYYVIASIALYLVHAKYRMYIISIYRIYYNDIAWSCWGQTQDLPLVLYHRDNNNRNNNNTSRIIIIVSCSVHLPLVLQ